jgi:hypothetical protein
MTAQQPFHLLVSRPGSPALLPRHLVAFLDHGDVHAEIVGVYADSADRGSASVGVQACALKGHRRGIL